MSEPTTTKLSDLVGQPIQVYFYGRIEYGKLSGKSPEWFVDNGHPHDSALNNFNEDEIEHLILTEYGQYKVVLKEWIEWTSKE